MRTHYLVLVHLVELANGLLVALHSARPLLRSVPES
jgi:hypothetical protein